MTKLDENLSEIFDVEPLKTSTNIDVTVQDQTQTQTAVVPINPGSPVDTDEVEMEEDFNQLRENQKDLLQKGKIALECALDIVQQSDHPRAVEVFSTLLGQMSKLNQEAMDLHEKRRKIKNAKKENVSIEETNVTNNNLIVTTTELNKMLTQMTTGKKKDAT